MRASAWLATGCAVIAIAHESRAQSGAVVQTEVSNHVVEVGQTFRFQFTVLSSSDDSPSRPRLPNPKGAVVQGPSLSTQQQVMMQNGRIERRQGFTATWMITPRAVGDLRVGPPSALLGQKTVQGSMKVVKVVPAGQAPAPRRQDPFDFFRRRRGSLFPPGIFDDPFEVAPDDSVVPDYPPEFGVERPSDPVAFLRSTVLPKRAVVGEQVTINIYAYGNRGGFREFPFSEPKAADFVSIPIVESSEHERMYQVDIGDSIWHAIKVRELALFPLRTGNLVVGGMKMGFDGRGYSRGNQALSRTSELVTVHVDEPPLSGRPPGYRIGDVGRYRLKADVTPRTVDEDGAVAVNVTLSGVGNLPTKLEVPQKKGIEWLEPRVTGELEAEGNVIKGERNFSYVVRLHKSGQVNLGDISLPHYDPKSKRYRQARAELGTVQVKPGAGAPKARTGKDSEQRSLSERLTLRKRLGRGSDSPWHWTDDAWFWALISLSPLSVLGFAGSVGLGRRLSARFRSKKNSAATLAAKALADARRALANGDETRAAAETERALFSAIEAATQVKARGILREQLVQNLTSHGLASDTAERATSLLALAEAARFTGAAQGSFGEAELDEGTRLVRELSRLGKAKASPTTGASA